jgi:amino acid permease
VSFRARARACVCVCVVMAVAMGEGVVSSPLAVAPTVTGEITRISQSSTVLHELGTRDFLVPIVAVCVLLPAAVAARRIESLRFVSMAALIVSFLFVVFMVVVATQHSPSAPRSFWVAAPRNALDFLDALAIVSFAFTCHFNVVPLLHALPRPENQFPIVIRASTAASAVVYWLVRCPRSAALSPRIETGTWL